MSAATVVFKPQFIVIATKRLDKVGGKFTRDCFIDISRYHIRDHEFERWLNKKQKPASACTISTIKFVSERNCDCWTYAQLAAEVLGLSGARTSRKMLGRALIKNGHTMTLVQAENMVEATERGDKTGMCFNDVNFFFLETGEKDRPVAVGEIGSGVERRMRLWCPRLNQFDDDSTLWGADQRFLIRNLNALKLKH